MGPYIPLVDYVDPNNTELIPQTGAPLPLLPSVNSCGQLNNQDGPMFPFLNKPSIKVNSSGNGPTDWPEQYWPGWSDNAAQVLNCGSNAAEPANQIDYVTTWRTTEAVSDDCNMVPNNCTQIIPESMLAVWDLPGHFTAQAPMPVTIVGTGFGYLNNVPLTLASCQTPTGCQNSIRVQNLGGSGLDSGWDSSAGAPCDLYIANWSDTSISLVTGVPPTINSPKGGCPVMYDSVHGLGDQLQFTVINPQSHVVMTSQPISVLPYTAVPN